MQMKLPGMNFRDTEGYLPCAAWTNFVEKCYEFAHTLWIQTKDHKICDVFNSIIHWAYEGYFPSLAKKCLLQFE